jgi:hypothetical protein
MVASRAVSFNNLLYRDDRAKRSNMDTLYTEPVLNTPINDLEFSDDFKLKTGLLRFVTLTDLLAHQPNYLIQLPGFGYRLLTEYIDFIEKENLGKYIMP